MVTQTPIPLPDPPPENSADKNLLVQSWYPLARATDVRRGQCIAIDVMGHALVVFRNLANKPGVIRRSCCHMGGDLARGRVTEQGIRCPIHSWEFGVDGIRLQNRSSKSQQVACQPSLACVQRNGIIFAFFGGDVSFDVPAPDVSVYQAPVVVRDFDARYDIPTVFGFDSEHFLTVHNRELDEMSLYSNGAHHLGTAIRASVNGNDLRDRLMRTVGLKCIETDIDFWAANLMLGHHKKSNCYAFLASLPLGENKMRMFVTIMQKRPDGGALRQWLGRLRFWLARPVIMGFVTQDEKALSGVRFDPQQSLLLDNPGVQRWLAHFRRLPKFLPSKLFDVH